MISFVPETLRIDLLYSISKLSFLDGNVEDIEFRALDKIEENVDDYDCEINEKSTVCLYIGEDDYPEVSVKEFLKMAQCKDHSKINKAQSYAKCDNDVYFLLNIRDYSTLELLTNTFAEEESSDTELVQTVIINNIKYTVGVFHGFCIYHLLVEESGNFDKYCPSYSPYDYFIRVHSDEKI